jgi:hypothetical protein
MACERGRTVQKEYAEAVAARLQAELLGPTEIRIATKRESDALMDRIIHVSGCQECWVDPPAPSIRELNATHSRTKRP